jgi:hypothetical protein
MNLRLIVAILAISAAPMYAQARGQIAIRVISASFIRDGS